MHEFQYPAWSIHAWWSTKPSSASSLLTVEDEDDVLQQLNLVALIGLQQLCRSRTEHTRRDSRSVRPVGARSLCDLKQGLPVVAEAVERERARPQRLHA